MGHPVWDPPPPVWDTYSDYSLGRQVIEEPSTERGGGSFARVWKWGFEESPRPAWAVGSYSSGPPAGGTPQIIVDKTSPMTGRLRVYLKNVLWKYGIPCASGIPFIHPHDTNLSSKNFSRFYFMEKVTTQSQDCPLQLGVEWREGRT